MGSLHSVVCGTISLLFAPRNTELRKPRPMSERNFSRSMYLDYRLWIVDCGLWIVDSNLQSTIHNQQSIKKNFIQKHPPLFSFTCVPARQLPDGNDVDL